jgi:carbamoyl-phosphate synthase small subunit
MPTPISPRPAARLAMADGTIFTGRAFGEAVFNTSLTGYQEILTDPSYAGQIVTMTNPMIGNYGSNDDDLESLKPQAVGFVVRELSNLASNFRSTAKLEAWLAASGVTGIDGIDTRALTRKLRNDGAMPGILCTDPAMSDEQLVAAAAESPGLLGRNLVQTVSRTEPLHWSEGVGQWQPIHGHVAVPDDRPRVVAIDCGTKLNILRNLADAGVDLVVLPWDASPDQIREHRPDGLFVSNGPGDPAAVQATTDTLREMRGELPTFGICLGHQLLARALGAETVKLKFGHRGGNQPVQNLGTGKVEITSQNHGFAVTQDSLKKAGGEPTHINLNDRTLEGFRHANEPTFAVQYHPEASPGPHDARYLFDCFRTMLDTGRAPSAEEMDRAQRARATIGAA